MGVENAVTWRSAGRTYDAILDALDNLRSKVEERTNLDRELTELELDREWVKNKARASVDEAYESLEAKDRKKTAAPTDHDRYLAAEEADKAGEFPKRIVETNRKIKHLGLEIETLSYEINVRTNFLRYLTAVEGSLHAGDPDVEALGARTDGISGLEHQEVKKV